MKPREVHLLILAVLCIAPTVVGVILFLKGERSHSEFSAFPMLMGLALMAASAAYAGLSSLLVWKLGTTPRRVFAVHAGIFGLSTVLFGLPRLFWLVAR